MEEERVRTDAKTIERLLTELEAEIERLESLLRERQSREAHSQRQAPRIPHVA